MIGIQKGYKNITRCLLDDLNLSWWQKLLLWIPCYRKRILMRFLYKDD